MKKAVIFIILSGIALIPAIRLNGQTPEERYNQMQRKLASGWNTWDTRSVLTHVFLPYGSAIDLNLINAENKRVDAFRIGDRNPDAPVMHPGPHSYDGTYTDISLEWKGQKLRVQSAADGRKNVILVTPIDGNTKGGRLVVAPKALWYRTNDIKVADNTFTIAPGDPEITFHVTVNGDFIEQKNGEIFMSTDNPVFICCGENMNLSEVEKFIKSHAGDRVEANKKIFGEYYEVYNAMQNVLSWDNIYDPAIRRVITPVSRVWNVRWSANPSLGGFVLFCWDTYFASMMLATGSKELAYANAVEITCAATENGFVPNFYAGNEYKSRDRSQPPVGSLAVWNIYQKYKEKWFLELVYDKLLTWNRWWDKNRNTDGLLCWGSNPFEKVTYRYWETDGVNNTYGGALESGLDNSHMYDNIPFDKEKHVQRLNDAGLSGLYVMDCDLLAKIAGELGKHNDVEELSRRGNLYRNNLNKLWDEKRGLYYNRRTDTGEADPRISPTNFYPLLANAPTQEQAKRMVTEHLLNPEEFWGEWIIPATPRNDPAFKDNAYWRGRIWAPLNFLVYMGLRNYDLPEARKALSEKSKNLLLKSWLKDGYVFENYNATTGVGDDVGNSDKFYHWGALLGFITLIEEGYFSAETIPAIVKEDDSAAKKITSGDSAFNPEKTAIIVIDMWNYHWCMTASQRVSAMVPRMNAVLDAARNLGMQVIWNPSDVVTSYSGYPQYERAIAVERHTPPVVRDMPPTTFTAPGGGCMCGPGFKCRVNYGWDNMHPGLTIGDDDLISSSTDEIYSLLTERGITDIIYMGVHTNMCVYAKPGAISYMWQAGFNCMLAGDLNDALTQYNPATGYTPDKGTAEIDGNLEAAGIRNINMMEIVRLAGGWKTKTPVDYVLFTPWGKPDRPYLTEKSVLVTLSSPRQENTEIRYTTDGSEPTSRSALYTAPLEIEQTTTLRATAFVKGKPVTLPSDACYVKMPSEQPPKPDVYLENLNYITNGYMKSVPGSFWYPQKWKSFEGKPLRVSGKSYAHGMGFRAPSSVQYEIKPEYKRFVALAGIDENMLGADNGRFTAMHSSVVFCLFIDGKQVAESPVMCISQEPWRFDVEIPEGSRYINLTCMDAGSRNLLDYGNWVDAGFITGKNIIQ